MALRDQVQNRKFAIITEIEPPKGVDVSEMIDHAVKVKGAVDAFMVPEMSNAVMRMSSLGGAMVLQSKGLETIMQVCCRDRNQLALQADLLAAYACGIKNIMAMTGDDPSFGDHHQARAVYGIQLPELLGAIRSLQSGKDMAGIELKGSPEYLVSTYVNSSLHGDELDRELEEMNQKIECGASVFITPPVFSLDSMKSFLKQVDHHKTHIIPTVLLLKSLGMARYIQRNMKQITIEEETIRRLQKAPDKTRECVMIAKEMIQTLKNEKFSGVMISTMGWENKLPELLGIL